MKSLHSYMVNEASDLSLFEFFAFRGNKHRLKCTGFDRVDLREINVNKINRRYEKILEECPDLGTFNINFINDCAEEIMTRLIRCIIYDCDWKKNIETIYDEVEDYIYEFFKSESIGTQIRRRDHLGVSCGHKYCIAFDLGGENEGSYLSLMWD